MTAARLPPERRCIGRGVRFTAGACETNTPSAGLPATNASIAARIAAALSPRIASRSAKWFAPDQGGEADVGDREIGTGKEGGIASRHLDEGGTIACRETEKIRAIRLRRRSGRTHGCGLENRVRIRPAESERTDAREPLYPQAKVRSRLEICTGVALDREVRIRPDAGRPGAATTHGATPEPP
jgi:hypothetical protein